jgi:hypothetical protein
VAAVVLASVAVTHWAVPAAQPSPAAWSQASRSLLKDVTTIQSYLVRGPVPTEVLTQSTRDLARARTLGTPAAPTLETVWTQALAETAAAIQVARSNPRVAGERLLLASQELSVISQEVGAGAGQRGGAGTGQAAGAGNGQGAGAGTGQAAGAGNGQDAGAG